MCFLITLRLYNEYLIRVCSSGMTCYDESLLNNMLNRRDFDENVDPFNGRLPLFDENNYSDAVLRRVGTSVHLTH